MTPLISDQAAAVVRERDRRRLRAMARVLVLGVVAIGVILGYVGLHVQRLRTSYQLEALRATRVRLEERNRRLQLEMASLRALARVASAAKRLGFMPPTPDQVQLAREYAVPDGLVRRAELQAEASGHPPAPRPAVRRP